jgi:DUF971 family protein
MAGPVPTNIEKQSDTEMSVLWSNGETTVIPFFELRFQCRCAECVDEWTRKRRIERSRIRPDIQPVRVEPVGRYAVQIDWNDGHRAGIYSFDLLYEIAKGAAK